MTPYELCLSSLFKLHRFGIKLGLDTINRILADIGNPHKDFKCIHIAGTNGKGSVAAMLSTILEAAGYCVGRYTSPHLERFNERICINSIPIDDQAVVAAHDRVRIARQLDRQPTFFEYTTAMALYEFSRSKVDWAIIEAGMGGRLDATNVISPALCIITNISLEHRLYLGHTIAAISNEKAGIIKSGTPVVTGVTQKTAREVIHRVAQERNAPVYLKGRDFRCRRSAKTGFSYHGLFHNWPDLELGLSGSHQVDNAGLTLAVCEILTDTHQADIPLQAVRQGMKRASWPGRLEVVCDCPHIILDGAHNLMAARVLARHLRQHYQNRKISLVVGVLDDKPCESILKDLSESCERAIITQPVIDRAIPARHLAAIARNYFSQIKVIPNVAQAVEFAIQNSKAEDVICVAGSLYVVGEAKTALRRLGIGNKIPSNP